MDSESSVTNLKLKNDVDNFVPVVVKARWWMLTLFCTVTLLNAFQWLHINIVAPDSVFFWNGSLPESKQGKDLAIAWLSMIYMLVYIPMIVPATWLLNHYGLRVSILIGAGLNALGAWIKCLSMELSQPYGVDSTSAVVSFPLLMVGQFVCASGQVFLLGVPAQLASTWFGKSELALATAIGVFGNQTTLGVR
nr:feline leukemia virus subgroup c receptor-related protein 1 [Hymenolepis microstoma]